MSQDTLINGNRHSFVNVSVQANRLDGFFSQPPKGCFKSLNYKATQEPGIVQGNQVVQVGRTEGYGVGTGSFEMLLSEVNGLYLFLTGGANTGIPILSVDWEIIVSYSNGPDTITDTLQGVRINDIDSNNTQSTDASMKTNTFNIARVYLNGIPAFGDLNPG